MVGARDPARVRTADAALLTLQRRPEYSLPPACCHVVPELKRFADVEQFVYELPSLLLELRWQGSYAAPGFKGVEGFMVWHTAARQMFKYTLDNDGHKGA